MGASAVLRLQKVGFTAEQVEALAAFMDGQAASKSDLLEVRSDLEKAIAELRVEMLRAELIAMGRRLEARIVQWKSDLLTWLIALLFGQLAGFAAIVKLL